MTGERLGVRGFLDDIHLPDEEDVDAPALPSKSLDLSANIRKLRARQGFKQSEIAKRMHLDPSIPSLWEKGKRLVPANRMRALAGALECNMEDLLDGIPGLRGAVPESGEEPPVSGRVAAEPTPVPVKADSDVSLLIAMRRDFEAKNAGEIGIGISTTEVLEHNPKPEVTFVPAERPALNGWIPDGWRPIDRVQDISPVLPDGYWLDPVKLERGSAKALLRSRLCVEDQALIEGREVPGASLAERIYQHCRKESGFLSPKGPMRLPLVETIFRQVLAADHGGLTDAALVGLLRNRQGAVPVTATLLSRLHNSVRPYPIRRVEAWMFGI